MNSPDRIREEPVRVAIVGAGNRGLGTHLSAIKRAPDLLRLVAAVDTPSEKPRVRRKVGDELAFDSSDTAAWVRTARPELAIVATPHDQHLSDMRELAALGVPVLVEKPPTMNLEEFKSITKEYETRVPLAVLVANRYTERHRPLRELLASPAPGSFIEIAMDVTFAAGRNGWRTARRHAGGGVLLDLGYHFLDLILHTLGHPTSAEVRLVEYADVLSEVEHEAFVTLRFAEIAAEIGLNLRARPGITRRFEIRVDGQSLDLVNEEPTTSAIATVAQVRGLLADGFLTGGGAWRDELRGHGDVMELVESLYGRATREKTTWN